jgi:hypothetical protein
MLHRTRIKAIIRDDTDAAKRLLLLHENITGPGENPILHVDGSVSDEALVAESLLASPALQTLCAAPSPADLEGLPDNLREQVRQDGLEIVDHPLVLDYQYWPADHILKVRLRAACDRR